MYKTIVVAYDESAEAQRAFACAISLAKNFEAELRAVTFREELPSYTAFASAVGPSLPTILREDLSRSYEDLEKRAQKIALDQGVSVQTHTVEGASIELIVDFLHTCKADLLVVGMHRHALSLASLWSRVHRLAEHAPCSVLGVH